MTLGAPGLGPLGPWDPEKSVRLFRPVWNEKRVVAGRAPPCSPGIPRPPRAPLELRYVGGPRPPRPAPWPLPSCPKGPFLPPPREKKSSAKVPSPPLGQRPAPPLSWGEPSHVISKLASLRRGALEGPSAPRPSCPRRPRPPASLFLPLFARDWAPSQFFRRGPPPPL